MGILGGGQLGRMLALAGYPLGLRFRFLEPGAATPVAPLGELVRAPYDDPEALIAFAGGLDRVTYEFENVPVEAARRLAESLPVRPPPTALEAAQDRLAEKELFRSLGVATAAYAEVADRAGLDAAVDALGLPAVLKTRRMGYDGKGQAVLRTPGDAREAWAGVGEGASPARGGGGCILERFVPFDRELSILGVRGRDGATAFYPLVENDHHDGILRISRAPAPGVSAALEEKARAYARRILGRLDYVGVLAVELFQQGDELLANELAPRVHNSGHWTLDGAECSQFENHLRAVCDLPLGPTAARGHSAMANLVGAVPDPAQVLGVPGAHLHLYDKEPRPGRKVGHVNVVADDPEGVQRGLEALRGLPGVRLA